MGKIALQNRMKKTIDNPKIFISYAWGTHDYQEKVLAFATQLMQDGIDVILDKWDLSEGNDTYAFMEKCVTDDTITNVLMLLDPVYATKADAHSGGVGTETQIISAQVYRKVTQDKFIPVVFERNEAGEVCKPAYLQGRLHFDLSTDEQYDSEYQRLVKFLYGVEVYPKPEKGARPEWVTKQTSISTQSLVAYDTLKSNIPANVKLGKFFSFLNSISSDIDVFISSHKGYYEKDEYLGLADEARTIRKKYLQILHNSRYVENSIKVVAEFFQENANALFNQYDSSGEICRIMLHELFIYTIAIMYKEKAYNNIGYLLSKTYFSKEAHADNGISSYLLFYTGDKQHRLDNAINNRDNKRYYSGTAQYWIETIEVEFCTKEEFVFADILCFNYSVYGKDFLDDWRWFPETYVYDADYASTFSQFAKRLISKEFLNEALSIFAYDSLPEFMEKFRRVESEIANGEYNGYRYSGSFRSAPLLSNLIKADNLGKVK